MPDITLKTLSTRLAVLEVACSRCERAGRYRVANLIHQFGGEMPLPHLAQKLCSDCMNVDTFTADRCDIHFPNLIARKKGLDV